MNNESYVRKAIEVARRSRENGNHPFGAILVGPDGEVLLEAENAVPSQSDCTMHAETRLVSMASRAYSREQLRDCTLYSSAEPCAMCSGAIYWSGIGRVVYGLAESSLLALTGSDPENPTLDLPCRDVFAHGQRDIEVLGPLLEEEASDVHVGFWNSPD
ncbi:MAG: nucleoside deaminase [Spirochaetaceae bacterium]|nr:MAG: nucleoside deaminase [Spirochaetaceae bacterium]